ncbi:unnamed protein product [Clavelina lepadiformis]|uniref:Alpha/beta hydrolase fold-3 domain-containing protein n=1 Tax=Clavelina lepadiformis TaxID=159417 RepID=A0ABP0GIC7_CLALP
MELLAMAAEETGFVVISPEYRRAPQFPFPIPYEDCLNVTLNFMKISEKYNVNPNKLVLIGDSAGGNLAMSITVSLIEMNKEDPTLPLPAMTTLIYPVLQMINFRLPSYQQNLQFMFSKSLIPKFWLTYIGYNDKLGLSHIIAENGHVNSKNETVQNFKALINADLVPERYKSRGYNNTMATFTEDEKSMLTDEVLSHFEKHYLDVRVAPLMASDEILAKMPRTHILVCEYDTLRDDGVSYVFKRCLVSCDVEKAELGTYAFKIRSLFSTLLFKENCFLLNFFSLVPVIHSFLKVICSSLFFLHKQRCDRAKWKYTILVKTFFR